MPTGNRPTGFGMNARNVETYSTEGLCAVATSENTTSSAVKQTLDTGFDPANKYRIM